LVLPWQGGLTGWIAVFGAILIELAAGIATNTSPMAVAAPILLVPAVAAIGLGVAQWFQARSYGAEPTSWWHFSAVGLALVIWLSYPIAPSAFDYQGADTPSGICAVIFSDTPSCLAHASAAMRHSDLTWWMTGVLIVAVAPLVRRSKIAAWASIPVAFAGCLVASHFLELLLVYYHATNA
jgi:hypothetical protein